MTGFSFAFIALASVSCAAAIFCAVETARVRRELLDLVRRLPLSQLQSVQSLLDSHTDALTDLANRLKMMKVRRASEHTDRSNGLPDPYKEPDAWRTAMNAKLARAKVPGVNN